MAIDRNGPLSFRLMLPSTIGRSVPFALSVLLCALPLVSVLVAAQDKAAPKTVWDGVFTTAQAERGRVFYAEHCGSCHGASLEGGEYRALRGERFWVSWQESSVDELLGQISANMPFSEDGSLKGTLGADTYNDIVAHILEGNGFPAGAGDLTASSAAGVQIVKKGGPGELPSGAYAQVVGCLARGDDRTWKIVRGTRPVRVRDNHPADLKGPLGDREYTLMFLLTPLDKFAGYRMTVRAALMGDSGVNGLNVRSIEPVASSCQ
jgi:mono/diheme cytochrome c family protein